MRTYSTHGVLRIAVLLLPLSVPLVGAACGLGSTSRAASSATDAGSVEASEDAGDVDVLDGAVCRASALLASTASGPCPGQQALLASGFGEWAGSPRVGPVPASTALTLGVELPFRNAECLDDPVPAVGCPNGPQVTPAQFAAEFDPTPCDYQGVIDFVEAHGFKVASTFSDRDLLIFSGTVADAERTFCVTVSFYLRRDGTRIGRLQRARAHLSHEAT